MQCKVSAFGGWQEANQCSCLNNLLLAVDVDRQAGHSGYGRPFGGWGLDFFADNTIIDTKTPIAENLIETLKGIDGVIHMRIL